MKVAALFSGGKDSVYALYIAQQYGWEITHCISIIPKNKDSWMYHSVNIHLTKLLAQAINIPYLCKITPGKKETELDALHELISPLPIDGVISGALASEYQRTRIEEICDRLEIKSFTPLWHKDPALLLNDQIQAGFSIIITGVFAEGLDQHWLGKTITPTVHNELIELHERYQINIAGEGGEYETLVTNGPLFHKHLLIKKTTVEWKRDHGTLLIDDAILV